MISAFAIAPVKEVVGIQLAISHQAQLLILRMDSASKSEGLGEFLGGSQAQENDLEGLSFFPREVADLVNEGLITFDRGEGGCGHRGCVVVVLFRIIV